jgi:hypothetical protein
MLLRSVSAVAFLVLVAVWCGSHVQEQQQQQQGETHQQHQKAGSIADGTLEDAWSQQVGTQKEYLLLSIF